MTPTNLTEFLSRCADVAWNRDKPAYKLRDDWLRILNAEYVGLHPADRMQAEAEINRMCGT